MDILLMQTDIAWLEPRRNHQHVGDIMRSTIGDSGQPFPDLVVLPEMFATGFCMDAPRCSAGWEKSLDAMHELSVMYDTAVAGTVAVETGGMYFNRFYFVRPDGSVEHYDKRHLFTFGGEHRSYTPGDKRVIVEWRGWRILLQTCYDLRFPVFARNRGDYDLAVYCANWPGSRIGAWDILLRARAIENACYVAGVNRVGADPSNNYPGHSVVVDPKGMPLAMAEENKECVIRCNLPLDELHRYRGKFPVLSDADEYTLK